MDARAPRNQPLCLRFERRSLLESAVFVRCAEQLVYTFD